MLAKKIIKKLLQVIIQAYQLVIIPIMPAGCCRFLPTCSHYANEAISLHGPIYGGWLALNRIFKCNPWGKSGVDEVPSRTQRTLNTTKHISGSTDD